MIQDVVKSRSRIVSVSSRNMEGGTSAEMIKSKYRAFEVYDANRWFITVKRESSIAIDGIAGHHLLHGLHLISAHSLRRYRYFHCAWQGDRI